MRREAESDFVAFVRQERPALVRRATNLTVGDSHLAEDLVQQTLTKVYRRWRQARPHAAAYAHRALLTTFLDHRRSASTRRETSVPQLWDAAEGSTAPGFGTERGDLAGALASLPPRMRAVVTLRYVEDLGVEETAELLGCTPGTVKSQASRALAKLRELVGEAPAPGPDAVSVPDTTHHTQE